MRITCWLGLLLSFCLLGSAYAATDFEPPGSGAQSLRLAHLRYLAEVSGPYAALALRRRFSAAQLAGGDTSDLRIKLAEQAADFGLLDAAAEDYRRDLAPSTGFEARNRDWFELAQAWYHRGMYAKAQSAFDNIFGDLPEELEEQLAPFHARLLIARGRNNKAVTVLRKWQRERSHDPLPRYNLAVALARAGMQQEGAGELNAVGTGTARDDQQRALRDLANLVLGFGYLEIGQGATARALFQRIRLHGPYSDKALLGMGWAEIAPDGERQKHTLVEPIHCVEDPARLLPDNLPVLHRIPRKACGPPEEFRDTDRFKTKKGGKTEADRYKRALVPWLELIRRDPQNSAVQEGLVAVAYAYAKLGARDRAREYFANAVQLLEPQHDNLTHAIKQLQTPPATGAVLPPGVAPNRAWFAQRWGLYTATDTAFLDDALSDESFRIAAQSLQDLTVLRDQLITNNERSQALQALLSGRRVALSRTGIALPAQLLAQQLKLETTAQKLAHLEQRVDATINNLGNYLRNVTLATALRDEQQLQAYLTNALVGDTDIDSIMSPVEQQP